jgi:hypothetical protein
MSEHEHDQQADRLERDVGDMERQAEQLEGRIDETRSDWERKQADESVPGAVDEREPEGPEPEPEPAPDEDD